MPHVPFEVGRMGFSPCGLHPIPRAFVAHVMAREARQSEIINPGTANFRRCPSKTCRPLQFPRGLTLNLFVKAANIRRSKPATVTCSAAPASKIVRALSLRITVSSYVHVNLRPQLRDMPGARGQRPGRAFEVGPLPGWLLVHRPGAWPHCGTGHRTPCRSPSR
jgi:hypothetical protein